METLVNNVEDLASAETLKQLVREKYTQIADQSKELNESSCCGSATSSTATGCCTIDSAVMAESYQELQGYVADADLGLGCGLPTEYAHIKEGNTVVDLGSGAGNDAFVARSIVGEKGKVLGIDFTERMIEKARENADKLGFNNVEFRQGDIEKMPLSANTADVVVSNCVLNLVPNKLKALVETLRILKPGGHFSVSDIVLEGSLPEGLRKDAEMYAGCVAGAIQKEDYMQLIEVVGFQNIQIQKQRRINLPDQVLNQYLSPVEIEEYKTGKRGIYSITVYGEKPVPCCEPGSGCC
ncbi:arsenite methyltransferase [Xanthocytophaga agilis]|uniref:Arsenite methyltransferase n=1 Tax=Xanthocytophaga agilis TaxID=3048010 RepID=A0AAE3UF39_9BACT|nr:arsenite methyltransferase [Xanthocytophaga agilis]MDJ1503443.1 arsenite methyltransferase [Xanthocytophaga agilis]